MKRQMTRWTSPVLGVIALWWPGLAACQGGGATPVLQFSGDEVRLALVSTGNRRLVEVRIGERGPYSFLIDTGSTTSVIDARIASELGLEVTGKDAAGAPGGEAVAVDVVMVPALFAGELTWRRVRMVALDLVGMTGGSIEGVLGMDLFAEVLLTLDATQGRATVSRGVLSPGDPDVVRLDASSEGVNFPLTVAGTEVMAHLDTGSPGGITLPLGLMASLPLSPDAGRTGTAGLVGGNRTLRARQLQGVVTLGSLEYRDPELTFMDPSPPFGNVGSALTDELVVTIDQRSGLLALRRPDRASPESGGAGPRASGPPRRLGVRFGGPGGSLSAIASVDRGSLGEQVGFLAGDIVLSLNGRPMAEYDVAALGELIRGTAVLTWEIDRKGERVTIVVR